MTNNYGLATLGAGLLAGCAHTPARYVETLGQPFEGNIEHGFTREEGCFEQGRFNILEPSTSESALNSYFCGESRTYTDIRGDGTGPDDSFLEIRKVSSESRSQLALAYQEGDVARHVILNGFFVPGEYGLLELVDVNQDGIEKLFAGPIIEKQDELVWFEPASSFELYDVFFEGKKAEYLTEIYQAMETIDSAMDMDGLSVSMLLRDEEFTDSLDLLLQETPRRIGR